MGDTSVEHVDPDDNVATAIQDLDAGTTVTVETGGSSRRVEATEDISFGHKIAVEAIADGETVRKCGKSIGTASADIEPGEWVHVHNVESNYGRGDLADQEGGD